MVFAIAVVIVTMTVASPLEKDPHAQSPRLQVLQGGLRAQQALHVQAISLTKPLANGSTFWVKSMAAFC